MVYSKEWRMVGWWAAGKVSVMGNTMAERLVDKTVDWKAVW